MAAESFEHHLSSPLGLDGVPRAASVATAGGAACGDLVRFGVAVEGDRVTEAGFEASGCGAMTAAGSAAVALARGRRLFEVARVGARQVADELGGLSPGKFHAADLVADALHWALGAAARDAAALAPLHGRVLVAMSGGVDSAVAAVLSSQAASRSAGGEKGQDRRPLAAPPGPRSGGDPVVAVTLELWRDAENDGERSCCSASAVRVARSLAHGMGLPHFTLDLRDEFRAGVVDPFLADHAAGLTPNPCVRCNGRVRLDAMIALADRLGAESLATGHYARVVDDGAGPLLGVAADRAKDQSYMLAGLAPTSLERLRFPLGELTKDEVRSLAREAGLAVADRAESQDLCFLAGTGKRAFLARHGGLGEREGEIVDESGRVLGRHRGQHAFTVGQRRGLGVGGGAPLYVLEKDARRNRVTVGTRERLRRSRVAVRDATLHRAGAAVDRVKLRYRSAPLPCALAGAIPAGRHARLEVDLHEPVLGAAPGQAAVLMAGDVVVGCGTIAA